MRGWVRVVAATLAVSLAGGCATDEPIGDLERMLVQTYLEPLRAAGIATSVTRACRILNAGDPEDTAETKPGGRPWHLAVRIEAAAPIARVDRVLTAQDVVVRRDGDQAIIQQIADEPGRGWDGTLSGSGETSNLELEYGNLAHEDLTGMLGWADACTDLP